MLSPNIPERYLHVLELQRLDVEANCGYRRDKLALLKLAQNGRFTGPVEAEGDHAHLDLWPNVNPVILGECNGDGGIQVELVGTEVGELLLLGLDRLEE